MEGWTYGRTVTKTKFSRIDGLGTGEKLEGGEGWCKHGEGHGFSCKHKREGKTIWCMSLRVGHYLLCKDAGVRTRQKEPMHQSERLLQMVHH